MNQTWKNDKKPNIGPDFGPFVSNLDHPFFFFFLQVLLLLLNIVPSYHRMQYKGKLMNKTWKNDKKPNFRPDFSRFWPQFGPPKFFSRILVLQDVRHCYKP